MKTRFAFADVLEVVAIVLTVVVFALIAAHLVPVFQVIVARGGF